MLFFETRAALSPLRCAGYRSSDDPQTCCSDYRFVSAKTAGRLRVQMSSRQGGGARATSVATDLLLGDQLLLSARADRRPEPIFYRNLVTDVLTERSDMSAATSARDRDRLNARHAQTDYNSKQLWVGGRRHSCGSCHGARAGADLRLVGQLFGKGCASICGARAPPLRRKRVFEERHHCRCPMSSPIFTFPPNP